MKKNFLTKISLILSMFLFMIGLAGCSSDDTGAQGSDHGTVAELEADDSCAEPCHTDEILYN